MLAHRSLAAARHARPAARQTRRTFHVDNVINNTTPFKQSGTRFTVGFCSVLGLGMAVPFVASWIQLYVLRFGPAC
ncbi:hypothetical protein JCM10207_001908 [Rhodosporidiobolus poonsookiae]